MTYEHLLDGLEADEASGSMKLSAYAEEMRHLKDKLAELEAARKPVQTRYDELRKRLLLDAMAEENVSGFKLASGGSVHIRRELYANVASDARDAFFAWLEDHGHGGLITRQVHPQTLKAWVKEQQENKNALPDMVTVYEEPVAVLRAK